MMLAPRPTKLLVDLSILGVRQFLGMADKLNDVGVIYFIYAPDAKAVKIGFTTHLKQRLHKLQSTSPCKLELLAQVQGTFRTEQTIHAVFHDYRLHGEWFRSDKVVLDFIARLPNGKLFSPSQIALAK